MKIKFMLAGLLGFVLALTWSIQPVDAATQLKKLGGHPFYKAKGLKAERVLPDADPFESGREAWVCQSRGGLNSMSLLWNSLRPLNWNQSTSAPERV